ncbi:alanine racemase [Zunongwangia endophytica]|uniref:Alanine racemase n=1 Tax=Zunongwangia endophytica TaxID=1808945 RepID=A0ABV8H5K7_9FLAO|nr:alanine racemase [Zunongwangia endophytica]MDN3596028.1 alanine racemase [Zunongwangia endophytica]
MPKAQETILEIDLNSLEHNYQYLRSKITPGIKMLGVVKAFAYGSDSVAIAKRLEKIGVDHFAVAYTKEGETIRVGGITKPVLVLHPQTHSFKTLIDHCLTPSLYSLHILKEFIVTAEKLNLEDYAVHININTGLNRLGFDPADIDEVISVFQNTSAIKLVGMYSHLAASEDMALRDFTKSQIVNFIATSEKIIAAFDHKIIRHLCNTSGILNYPEASFDMVRSGIGLYGYGNSTKHDSNLKPVATLKTIISQIHRIKEGESVGYNRGYIAKRDTTTATLPLGHADGISRIYGKEKTSVLINGKEAPIIGNVCMDMLMVDVTDINCKEGDEAIFFGKERSAEKFANKAGTISYELVTAISQRVKRHIIE